MMYYYALWIPQTKAGIPVVLTESQDTRTLKDDPDDDVPEINLRGYIEKSSLHIHIAYSCGKEPERELLFRLLEATEQGFLIYQLNIEKEDSDYLRNILHNNGLHNAIYHYIKGFFHEHIYHDSTDDSLLSAFTSSKKISFNNPDCVRAILTNYLSPYELKYSGYVKETTDTLNCIVTNLSGKQGLRPNVELAKSSILNNIKVLDGESQYCDFLIKSFTSDVLPMELVEEITNQRHQLRILNDQLTAIASYLTSVVSLRLADLSVYLGLWSIILSIVLFAIPRACSHEDEDRQIILNEYHDIQKAIGTQKKQFDKQLERLSNNQDSILKLLKKPTPKK